MPGRLVPEGEQCKPMTEPVAARGEHHAAVPGLAEPDLAALMRRSAGGDEAAFAEVYDATSPRVYGLAVRVTRSPEVAAEVVQEVYFMAWEQSGQFLPDRGSVVGWLCTMAHRRAVDRVRQTVSERDREQAYQDQQPQPAGDQTWEEVEQSMAVQEVRNGLGSLTPLQREAVALAYYDGFTHQEVARKLDIPLGTAKARIRDGLRNLRSALGGQS